MPNKAMHGSVISLHAIKVNNEKILYAISVIPDGTNNFLKNIML